MKLQDQVTSLEISKRLKELGVKQESVFFWAKTKLVKKEWVWHLRLSIDDSSGQFATPFDLTEITGKDNPACSAFTVAELGDMLPEVIIEKGTPLNTKKSPVHYPLRITKGVDRTEYETIYWEVRYGDIIISNANDTEADARGKMLIYLLENKLITL